MIKFGETIRELRLVKDLTQAELATLTGLKRLTISQIETNRRGISPKNLSQLALALDVPISFISILSDCANNKLLQQFQRIIRKSLRLHPTK